MWAEFVVHSLLCSERFFRGTPVFPSSQNQHFQIPIRPEMVEVKEPLRVGAPLC